MSKLSDHARSWLLAALAGLPPEAAATAQALSLWIWDIDDDPRQATAELAVLWCAPATLSEGMVIDGGHGIMCSPEEDTQGAAVRDAWSREAGVWYDHGADDPTLVWDEDKGDWTGGLTEAFASEVAHGVAELRRSGELRIVLGCDVPVFVHEGRDVAAAERWTSAANPDHDLPL